MHYAACMPQAAADGTSPIPLQIKLMGALWEDEFVARKAENEACKAESDACKADIAKLQREVGSLILLPVGWVTGARVTGARVGSRSGLLRR